MNPQTPFDQNNIFQGTFLGSKYFDPIYLFNQGYTFFQNVFNFITSNQVSNFYYLAMFVLTVFFLFIISYCMIRMYEIRKKEKAHLAHEIAEYAHHHAEREKKKRAGEDGSKNERWIQTLTYLFSNNASDWKLSIIEADSMLDSLLDQLGFTGESLGEKLKSANQGNFRNLSLAWEAHTIRNRIAHEGLSYEMSQHEAKRVIALYEKIFREYGFI